MQVFVTSTLKSHIVNILRALSNTDQFWLQQFLMIGRRTSWERVLRRTTVA